jgi:two-component system, cell cycle sensor histidine kinase and response regulator CckA
MAAATLLKLSRALHGVRTLEDLVARVRTALIESTRYDRVYLHLLHPDQKTFEIVGWVLPNMDLVRQRMATIDVSRDALLQRIFRETEPSMIADMRLDPDADQAQVEFFGNRTCICVPMFDGDHQIGPLVVSTFADQGVVVPTDEEFAFIVQIASLVAVVIGRMRAEESHRKLEEANAASERMSALGRMAGEVAHDVNNVLFTILCNLEFVEIELGDHPVRPLLTEAQNAAQRAGQFMRQLLAYARGQVLEMQRITPAELLHSVAEMIRPLLPDGVTLQLEASPDLGVILGDKSQLERVFLNLGVNARDALRGAGRITLEARPLIADGEYVAMPELAPGNYLVVSVSDDGDGMSQETQARIFEPFFSTKGAERGTGLGLSVVEGIVRQHRGYVHVYSELGLGTTFKIYLPRDAAARATVSTPPEPPLPLAALRGGERLLVVDDDEPVRRTLLRILEGAGCSVQLVGSSAEALDWLRSKPVDLLLTDVVLGKSDGLQLAREARQLLPELKVLFMTGYARGKLNELSLPHLSKPFAASELLTRLRQTLAQPPIRLE